MHTAHFLALASVALHVLVDRAKARAAVKRGGGQRRVSWARMLLRRALET